MYTRKRSVYTHTQAHTHKCTHAHTRMHTHTQARIHTYAHVCSHTHRHRHPCSRSHTNTEKARVPRKSVTLGVPGLGGEGTRPPSVHVRDPRATGAHTQHSATRPLPHLLPTPGRLPSRPHGSSSRPPPPLPHCAPQDLLALNVFLLELVHPANACRPSQVPRRPPSSRPDREQRREAPQARVVSKVRHKGFEPRYPPSGQAGTCAGWQRSPRPGPQALPGWQTPPLASLMPLLYPARS